MSVYRISIDKQAADGIEWDPLTVIVASSIFDLERALTEWATTEIPDANVTVMSDGSQVTTTQPGATDTEVT